MFGGNIVIALFNNFVETELNKPDFVTRLIDY